MRRLILASSFLTIFGGGYALLKPSPAAASASFGCCAYYNGAQLCCGKRCVFVNEGEAVCY